MIAVRRMSLGVIMGAILLVLTPHVAFAASTTSDLINPQYLPHNLQWPLTYYQLDYVPNNVNAWDIVGKVQNTFYEGLNILFNAIWYLYMLLALCMITLVTWAYNLKIIDMLLGTVSTLTNSLRDSIWIPMWVFMASLAVGWMIYYFMRGRVHSVITTIVSTGLIIAMSTWIFGNIPNELQKFDNVSAAISTSVLQKAASADGVSGNAVDSMADILNTFLVIDPYDEVEFGSRAEANQFMSGLMAQGDNPTARTAFISQHIGQSNMPLAYQSGTGMRLGNLLVSVLAGVPDMAFLVLFVLMVLWWQFIAIGRAVIAATALIIAMWPGYGLRFVGQWAWSVVAALFHRVFLTIMLSISLLFTTSLDSLTTSIGWLPAIFLNIACMVGVGISIWDLRKQLFNLPVDGGALAGNVESTPGAGLLGMVGRRAIMSRILGAQLNRAQTKESHQEEKRPVSLEEARRQRTLNVPETLSRQNQKNRSSTVSQRGENTNSSPNIQIPDSQALGNSETPGKIEMPANKEADVKRTNVPLWNQPQSRNGWVGLASPITGNQLQVRIPNLPTTAQRTYQAMTTAGLNPLRAEHRKVWVQDHPQEQAHVEEIEQYQLHHERAEQAIQTFEKTDTRPRDGSSWVTYIDPSSGRQMQLRNPVLNRSQRQLYRTMKEAGYNPRNPNDVSRWIDQHPKDEPVIEGMETVFESQQTFNARVREFRADARVETSSSTVPEVAASGEPHSNPRQVETINNVQTDVAMRDRIIARRINVRRDTRVSNRVEEAMTQNIDLIENQHVENQFTRSSEPRVRSSRIDTFVRKTQRLSSDDVRDSERVLAGEHSKPTIRRVRRHFD